MQHSNAMRRSGLVLGLAPWRSEAAAVLLRNGEVIAGALEAWFVRRVAETDHPLHAARYCLEEAGVDASSLDAVAYAPAPANERLPQSPPRKLAMAAAQPLAHRRMRRRLVNALRDGFNYRGGVEEIPAAAAWADAALSAAPAGNGAVMFLGEPGWRHGPMCVEFRDGAFVPAQCGEETAPIAAMLNTAGGLLAPNDGGSIAAVLDYASRGKARFVDRLDKHAAQLFRDPGKLSGAPLAQLLKNVASGPVSAAGAPTAAGCHLARSVVEWCNARVVNAAAQLARAAHAKTLVVAAGGRYRLAASAAIRQAACFDEAVSLPAQDGLGAALGAARNLWRKTQAHGVSPDPGRFPLDLGPWFGAAAIRSFLIEERIPHKPLPDGGDTAPLAEALTEGEIVGWFEGAMGAEQPGAGRCILGDARNHAAGAQAGAIAYGPHGERPLCAAVTTEQFNRYFQRRCAGGGATVLAEWRESVEAGRKGAKRIHKKSRRSALDYPAVLRKDGTVLAHIIDEARQPRLHALAADSAANGGPALFFLAPLADSGGPPVCTPDEAYRLFMKHNLELLVLEGALVEKRRQEVWSPGAEPV